MARHHYPSLTKSFRFTMNSPVKFTQAKAKKILSEEHPTLRGHPITKKQRGLLGVIAGGRKPTRLKK